MPANEREQAAGLLQQARIAGVLVRVEGERLVLRGQRSAQPLMRELLAHKVAVLAALRSPFRRVVHGGIQKAGEPGPATSARADPLVDLEAALRAHDWYYSFTDDPGVRRRGEESERRLLELTRNCDPAAARALWQRHHPGPDTPASPGLWPGEDPTVPASAGWDAARASAVVAEVDALVDAAVAVDGGASTPARRNVIEGDRAIVRRLAASHDPMLWSWPQSIPRLLARWRQDDETRQAADNAGRQLGRKESP